MAQLETTRHGPVAVLTLKRPDAQNRITSIMAEELVAALAAARADPTVGGCVLTGHGDVCCLGGDYDGAGPATAAAWRLAERISTWPRRWLGWASR
jgi:enoyl-CoA hydratase/carnithine racemase